MRMRRIITALLSLALIVGCSAGATQIEAPATQGDAPKEINLPPATELVKPVQGVLTKVTYGKGEAIAKPGAYLLDVTTGKVEGWQPPTGATDWYIHVTDDMAWLWRQDYQSEQTYLINRSTGDAWVWHGAGLFLQGSTANLVIFERAQDRVPSGVFDVLDNNMKHVVTFYLPKDTTGGPTWVQVSPDGKQLLVVRPADLNQLPAEQPVYLVDLSAGTTRRLGDPFPAVEGLKPTGVELAHRRESKEIYLQYPLYGANGGPNEVTVIRRYNWQGEKLAEYRVAGRLAEISPDGRLATTGAYLSFTSSVSLFDLSTGKPLFRVAGAFGGTWLAGDKEFLVNTLDFGGRLVSTGGAMRAAPVRPHRDFWYMGSPLPSPADADLFAWGPVIMDAAGNVRTESPLAVSTGRFVHEMRWSPTGKEVYFNVGPAPGKDGDIGYRPIIAPAVQKAPFPEKYLLQVKDPKGECLNLRDSSSTGAKVIRCLPTGTKLAIGDPDKIGEKGAVWQYGDERVWLWVVTEKGEEGWVASDTGSLAWAE